MKRRVTFDNNRKRIIICGVHGGLGDEPKAKVSAAHCGRESTHRKLADRFYCHSMAEDVKEYIKTAKTVNSKEKFLKILDQNYKVPIPSEVMKQIGPL